LDFITTAYSELSAWVFGGVPLYLFVLKAVKMMEHNVMLQILNELKDTTLTPQQACYRVMNILETKSEIVCLFSIFPCTWFFYIFANAIVVMSVQQSGSAFTELITKENAMNWEGIFLTYEFFAIIILVIHVMFLAESISKESKLLMGKVSVQLTRRNNIMVWSSVLEALEMLHKFQLTAWNLFDINKQLMLYFVSSLVTLTIMFLQLLNKKGQ